jgi:hypothetical protein
MFHRSLRCTLEAIVTQAIAVIIAFGGLRFYASRLEQFGRFKSITDIRRRIYR